MIDSQPNEEKALIEEKMKKAVTERAAAVPTLENLRQDSFAQRRMADAHGEASGALGSGATAGVLTSVDEDESGEAELPRDFEYFSDAEEE